MRKQIKRLSPHQNGKVFGVLMAAMSLLFVIPMLLAILLSSPLVDAQGNRVGFPAFFVILFPVLYFIVGYLGTLLASLIYNFLYKYIGGLEFEVRD